MINIRDYINSFDLVQQSSLHIHEIADQMNYKINDENHNSINHQKTHSKENSLVQNLNIGKMQVKRRQSIDIFNKNKYSMIIADD